MLDSYWQMVVDKRTGKTEPEEGFVLIEEMSPMTDLFKSTAEFNEKKDGGIFNHNCVLPGPQPFWHAMLAFYSIYFPEVFPEPKDVAASIISFFPKMELHPSAMENFTADHYAWLKKQSEGEPNVFFSHPTEVILAMHIVLWTQPFQKMPVEEVSKLEIMLWNKKFDEDKFLQDFEQEWIRERDGE